MFFNDFSLHVIYMLFFATNPTATATEVQRRRKKQMLSSDNQGIKTISCTMKTDDDTGEASREVKTSNNMMEFTLTGQN